MLAHTEEEIRQAIIREDLIKGYMPGKNDIPYIKAADILLQSIIVAGRGIASDEKESRGGLVIFLIRGKPLRA